MSPPCMIHSLRTAGIVTRSRAIWFADRTLAVRGVGVRHAAGDTKKSLSPYTLA